LTTCLPRGRRGTGEGRERDERGARGGAGQCARGGAGLPTAGRSVLVGGRDPLRVDKRRDGRVGKDDDVGRKTEPFISHILPQNGIK